MRLFNRAAAKPNLEIEAVPALNKYYITSPPSPQNAIDILKGEWSSRFPPPLDELETGAIPLFEDARVDWFLSGVGDIKGKKLLELGPLEGGHSYMLDLAGAESVIAIESNTHAYLKCLIAKEVLGMRSVSFLCGDFMQYLQDPACPQFDIGVASGVLYHMQNPVELLSLLSQRCCSHLFLWTHYYDEAWAKKNEVQKQYPSEETREFGGFSHRLVKQLYPNDALSTGGFCGGSLPHSNWMYREEIIACLKHFDFPRVEIGFDNRHDPIGPCFTLLASRE